MIKNLLTGILLLSTTTMLSQTIDSKKHPIDIKMQKCLESDSSQTTAGMIKCVTVAAKEWDIELNKYYKLLMSVLKTEEKEKLRVAQQKWIEYRDNEFSFSQIMYSNMDGTMWLEAAASRRNELIRQRALELKEYYEVLTL